MTRVTAYMVKDLRLRTGAGLMDCKKALSESDGDMTAAADWLRLKGRAGVQKRAGRRAEEGAVAIAINDEGSRAAIIEVNCETDFVARNDVFGKFAGSLARHALITEGDAEALLSSPMKETGATASDHLEETSALLGERLILRRVERLEASEGEALAAYTHGQTSEGVGRIGVVVAMASEGAAHEKLAAMGRQVAMHVAASRPLAVDVEDLPPSVLQKERELLEEEARQSGKPDKILGKIVEGRLNKFYAESVLMKQEFVVNPDLTVGKALAEAGMRACRFSRLALGEDAE